MENEPKINPELEPKAPILSQPSALGKTENHGSKPKNKLTLPLIIVSILAATGFGLAIYEYLNPKIETNTETVTVEKTKIVETTEPASMLPITIKSDGLINKSEYDYVYSNAAHQTLAGFLRISEDSKTVSFLSPNQEYLRNLGITSYDPTNSTNTITFDEEVADVYFGGKGQAAGGESLYFLMKDGTVEYMPLLKALRDNDVRSYGKIKGVEGVVKLQMAGVSFADPSIPGGHVTTIAVKGDGTFYDLMSYSSSDNE